MRYASGCINIHHSLRCLNHKMNHPDYKTQILIKCMTCSQYVKANGMAVMPHVEVFHLFSKGEKAALCRKCLWKFEKQRLNQTWRLGELVTPADTEIF